MLSTEMLLGPQTSSLFFRASSCKINSINVCVLPVPGGPWMSATSRDARANLMASFCELLSVGSIQVGLSMEERSAGTGVGVVRPKRTRMKGV